MAVTSSNPKAGWTWTRYVDSGQGLRRRSPTSSVDTTQHHERPGAHVDLVALLHRLPLAEPRVPGERRPRPTRRRPARLGQQPQVVGVEDDDPVVTPVPIGNGERRRLVVGVEQNEEAVVGDLLAP